MYDKNMKLQKVLLSNIKKNIKEMEKLLKDASSHWQYEDPIYRFYYGSFKVFYIQDITIKIVKVLGKVAPEKELNVMFLNIIKEGTNKKFVHETTNKNWMKETKPLVDAFFHAKFFLEMLIKYGKKLKGPVSLLDSGWAVVLCLFNIR